MKVLNLVKKGSCSHFIFDDIPLPKPGPNEVLIKVVGLGVNVSDYKIYSGIIKYDLPKILGMECSGHIKEIGENVTEFQINDEVFALCFSCCSNGSFAEYVSVRKELVYLKPKNISFAQAASLCVSGLTSYRALLKQNFLSKNKSILISGAAGGVGSMLLQIASQLKFSNIVLIVKDDASKDYLFTNFNLSKNNIITSKSKTQENLFEEAIEKNGNKKFDFTIDCAGNDIKALCFELTKCSGHFVTTQSEDSVKIGDILSKLENLLKNITVQCVFIGAEALSGDPTLYQDYQKEMAFIANAIERKEIAPPLITVREKLTIKNIYYFFSLFKKGGVKGKLVIAPAF